jgi:hypothetical protein
MGSEMKIELPTKLIEDTIRAEMIRTISDDKKDKIIETIVRNAMEKKKDSYRSETYFEEAIGEMIRLEAVEIFRQWIDKNRKDISDALFNYMNQNKQKRLKEFCENLSKQITSYGIQVHINLKDDR